MRALSFVVRSLKQLTPFSHEWLIACEPCVSLYPYSTQATNRPNRHELVYSYSGGGGGGGIREVSLNKISPIVMFYESVPIQIRCRYEYSGESAQFGWNRARIHYD